MTSYRVGTQVLEMQTKLHELHMELTSALSGQTQVALGVYMYT